MVTQTPDQEQLSRYTAVGVGVVTHSINLIMRVNCLMRCSTESEAGLETRAKERS